MYTEKLSSGSTIVKFDNFLKQDDTMLVQDNIKICIGNTTYYLQIIIDKISNKYKEACQNPISVSELKKCFKLYFDDPLQGKPINEVSGIQLLNISIPAYHFLLYFKNSLEQTLLQKELKENDIIYLDTPITIHAQTSDDMDYEWEGNRYGDTSAFYVIGYQIKYIFTYNSYHF